MSRNPVSDIQVLNRMPSMAEIKFEDTKVPSGFEYDYYNPYNGTSETFALWRFAAYEVYQGFPMQQPEDVGYETYHRFLIFEGDEEYGQYQVTMPRFTQPEDIFTQNVNLYYQDLLKSYQPNEDEMYQLAGVGRSTKRIEFWGAFSWNRFYTVICETDTRSGRGRSVPNADNFDAMTGRLLIFHKIFMGSKEDYELKLKKAIPLSLLRILICRIKKEDFCCLHMD